mmetsp:Transcript_23933/g.48870  ORF Transcript_23933/g.48870 Transcript_23933/m.48870 type:complete len:116 (-) Transcript_23933:160-507(-)
MIFLRPQAEPVLPEDLPTACKEYKDTDPAKYQAALDDDEYYCHFVFQDTYDRVAWSGAVACAISVVLAAIVIVARDIMKVFDCCGVTKGAMAAQAPMRSLTTMSAGYAVNTQAAN